MAIAFARQLLLLVTFSIGGIFMQSCRKNKSYREKYFTIVHTAQKSSFFFA